ncbi:MAG: DNA polymerase Y family protein, partial [Acidimicrobiales bacterium]
PGQVPVPAPATVLAAPVPAEVVGDDGAPVTVSGRGLPSSPPAHLSIEGRRPEAVVAWAGPWPADERWWDPQAHRRRARWQLVTASGAAHLLTLEAGRWSVEATYD